MSFFYQWRLVNMSWLRRKIISAVTVVEHQSTCVSACHNGCQHCRSSCRTGGPTLVSIKLKFHGTRFPTRILEWIPQARRCTRDFFARILAKISRGCCEETGPVEFQLHGNTSGVNAPHGAAPYCATTQRTASGVNDSLGFGGRNIVLACSDIMW